MIPTASSPVVDVFRQYTELYQLRNNTGGALEPHLENEWKELSFTLDSIFSGMYRPDPDDIMREPDHASGIRNLLPVEFLRVPTETDVLCETPRLFFSGRLQDIGVGGAYVHASNMFELNAKMRLTFCTFRDEMPLELEGRVAWSNPRGTRKRGLLEGAGVQWVACNEKDRHKLEEYVYELVEETLFRANLI